MSNFSLYIKKIRKEKSLTQQELADELSVSATTIKRIESGHSRIPNSRLLENLSNYMNQSNVDVMEDVLFLADKKSEDYNFGLNFLAYMYINGWNFELNKKYEISNKNEPEIYLALLTKKRHTTQCLVKTFNDSDKLYQQINNGEAIQLVFDQVSLSNKSQELKSVRNFIYLFNNQNPTEIKIFNTLKELYFEGLKLNIKIVLYDTTKNEVLDQSSLSGRPFVLKDNTRCLDYLNKKI